VSDSRESPIRDDLTERVEGLIAWLRSETERLRAERDRAASTVSKEEETLRPT
jgi:uncharacterized small protein (DUF1192 family)